MYNYTEQELSDKIVELIKKHPVKHLGSCILEVNVDYGYGKKLVITTKYIDYYPTSYLNVFRLPLSPECCESIYELASKVLEEQNIKSLNVSLDEFMKL